ncbi:agmatine deiminase family protein [Bradyrhizobium sp. CCGB01]|nr:agmatine deiminase family protein [Bradyrhizobium sp. CCGB01]
MSWAVHREWGSYSDAVKRELRKVILTIANYEPVMLLTPPDLASEATAQFAGKNVEIVPAPVSDVWMRDIMPTFAFRGSAALLIGWNFNGWGSTATRPARAGDRLVGFISTLTRIPVMTAPFVCEGGAIITDGRGTVLTTKSCLLTRNRNRTLDMKEIEGGFAKLGARQLIWLDGDPEEPITSGHPDGYVLFSNSGTILVEAVHPLHKNGRNREQDIRMLEQIKDVDGREPLLKLVLAPRQRYWRYSGRFFAPCYLNGYVTNGALLAGRFGDPERDELARLALKDAFPGMEIHMLEIDHIAAGGGGIRCLTQPQIEPRSSL